MPEKKKKIHKPGHISEGKDTKSIKSGDEVQLFAKSLAASSS